MASEREIEGRSYPRDLLRRFAETSCRDGPDEEEEEMARGGSGEMELSLSLGLSLNGCFGVDRAEKRGHGLVRSSSLSVFERDSTEAMPTAPLTRTCSLPTETEEELRRKKELQSLKRLEAKRKRLEKRTSKSAAEGSLGVSAKSKSGKLDVELSGCSQIGGRPVKGWAKGGAVAGAGHIKRQLSIVSQGSSGVSELEYQPMQEDPNPLLVQSMPNHTCRMALPVPSASMLGKPKAEADELSKKAVAGDNGAREMMEEMPCVTTKGEGPHGKRIQGFLYRYREGEEVRIVCVCHGSFLTPAEFVRHAGGGDVDHPLRHIVVYPNRPTDSALS